MRAKTAITIAILIPVTAILAQETARIFSELQKTNAFSSQPEPVAEQLISAEAEKSVAAAPTPAVVDKPVIVDNPVTTQDGAVETIRLAPDTNAQGTMKSGLISLNLKEVELSSVIRLFATLSDANIIVPELDAGAGATKIDVNLKEVEWKPALQSILETQGFELYEKNPGTDVYSVRKKMADAPEKMNVKIFKMDYANVSNVTEMIKIMVPEPGKISVFPARNTIVIQSTPENLLEVGKMIDAVDLPRQQVFIEAKFMELTDGASEKLGIDWQVLDGYGAGVSGISGTYGSTKTRTDTTKRMYDMNGNQLSPLKTYQERVVDSAGGVTYVEAPAGAAGLPNVYGGVETATKTVLNENSLTKTLGATLSASDFNLVLAALKEVNGTKIVSNPKIIVANEETAQIYIGQKEPNIKQQTTQVQNADPITTYNLDPDMPYFEYGIKLNVTPSVNTASNITVNIAPSLTRFVSDKVVGNAGTENSFPITAEKTIQTVFSLSSGQTAAIGGLTEARADNVDRKVPLLGSLPLIGRFFSYSEKNDNQTETIIFVTVGLANPDNINMDTGLPQDSSLALRYDAKTQADRQIKAEELKVITQHETERAQEAIQTLQAAERSRLEKSAK